MEPDHHQKNSINIYCQPLHPSSIYTAIYTAQIMTPKRIRRGKQGEEEEDKKSISIILGYLIAVIPQPYKVFLRGT
jgi:hypothetical protein